MPKARLPQGKWLNFVFFLCGFLVVFADQLSKFWIRANLPYSNVLFSLEFFRIVNVRNTGAAFGLFQNYTPVLAVFSIIGVVIILICNFWLCRHISILGRFPGRVALGLMLGGTAGNLIDRLYFGYVTDFIDFTYWPAFNLADASVTVGSIWLVISYILLDIADRHQDGRNHSVFSG